MAGCVKVYRPYDPEVKRPAGRMREVARLLSSLCKRKITVEELADMLDKRQAPMCANSPVLLTDPGRTGKTTLSLWFATHVLCRVTLYIFTPFCDADGLSHLHSLVQSFKAAENPPVLVFDEVDALAGSPFEHYGVGLLRGYLEDEELTTILVTNYPQRVWRWTEIAGRLKQRGVVFVMYRFDGAGYVDVIQTAAKNVGIEIKVDEGELLRLADQLAAEGSNFHNAVEAMKILKEAGQDVVTDVTALRQAFEEVRKKRGFVLTRQLWDIWLNELHTLGEDGRTILEEAVRVFP